MEDKVPVHGDKDLATSDADVDRVQAEDASTLLQAQPIRTKRYSYTFGRRHDYYSSPKYMDPHYGSGSYYYSSSRIYWTRDRHHDFLERALNGDYSPSLGSYEHVWLNCAATCSTNSGANCDHMAVAGQCERQSESYDWMRGHCGASCSYDLLDSNSDTCEHFAREGLCGTRYDDQRWVLEVCQNTCCAEYMYR